MKSLKIGEVAKRAGVSVRTLHYYEELGLLVPTTRTSSGHRLYGRAAIERLQQIKSLQQIGLSLSEVDALFRGQGASPQQIVAEHLEKVQKQQKALAQLEGQLHRLAKSLERDDVDDAEAVELFLSTMEAITIYDKYLTTEQLEVVNQKHLVAHTSAEKDWSEALDAIREEMNAGTAPDSAKARESVECWHKAIEAFMPQGDHSLYENMMKAFREEPKALKEHGLSPELFAYIGKVLSSESNT